MEQKASEVSKETAKKVYSAKESAEDTAQNAKESTVNTAENAKESTKEFVSNAAEKTKDTATACQEGWREGKEEVTQPSLASTIGQKASETASAVKETVTNAFASK